MKRYLSIFAFAIVALATSFALTSCGGDDVEDIDDPVDPTPTTQTYLYTASMSYAYGVGGSALDYRTIYLNYLKEKLGNLCEISSSESSFGTLTILSVKMTDVEAFETKLVEMQENDASTLDELLYNDGYTTSSTLTIKLNSTTKYSYTYKQKAQADYVGTYTATVEAGTYTLEVYSEMVSATHNKAQLTLTDGTVVPGWVYKHSTNLTFNSDEVDDSETHVYHMLSTYPGDDTSTLLCYSLKKLVDGNYEVLAENITFTKN